MVFIMSYSRWSNSKWYSFYNCSGDSDVKENQILSLWYISEDTLVNFSYDDLLEIKTPHDLARCYKSEIPLEELVEAMEYIQWFIEDVEEEFGNHDKK